MNPLVLLASLGLFSSPSDPARASSDGLIGPTYRFADFDGDGLGDIFAVRPVDGDRLFKNQGNGTFVDVTERAGLGGLSGSRLALWQDFDGDGAADLYVSAANGASHLFRNDHGVFRDVTEAAGVRHAENGELYAAWIDYDQDARPDLHVVTPSGDRVYHNVAGGRFEQAELPALGLGESVTAIQPPVQPETTVAGELATDGAARALPELTDLAAAAVASAGGDPVRARRARRLALAARIAASAGAPLSSPILAIDGCSPTIGDQASGSCLGASSTPTLGMLYPLSSDFFVGANGNVGIGTTEPRDSLDVAGAISVDYSEANDGSTKNALRFGAGRAGEAIGSKQSPGGNQNGLDFYTSERNRLAISRTGNVGIGTDAPEAPLDIALGDKSLQIRRDGNLVPGINVLGTNGNEGILRLRNSLEVWPDDAGVREGRLDVRDVTGATRAAIAGSGDAHFLGKVGIGTSAPQVALTVAGGIKLDYFDQSTGVVGPYALTFGDAVTGEAITSKRDVGGNQNGLDFWTGWGARMSITNQGDVGIGTSAPGSKLELFGPDASLGVRNSNDFVGGFVGDSWRTLQLGMHNPGDNFEGVVPPHTKLSFFGVDDTGRVGSLTNVFGQPVYRNLLDDGQGRCGIGRVPTSNALEVQGDACKTSGGGMWLVCSDRRIKTDIETIESALATVDRLRLVAYHYNDEYLAANPGTEDKLYYNVIAQEYAEVFPEYVKARGEDGILQVDTHPALIHAIAAVQELHGIVEKQEAELRRIVETKDAQITALEARLAHMERAVANLASTAQR